VGGSALTCCARWAAGSRITGWVNAHPVLWRSEVVLLDNLTGCRQSSSSGVLWTVAYVTFSVASSTVPSVEVIEDVDLRICKNCCESHSFLHKVNG
jgi:hypothetical protein